MASKGNPRLMQRSSLFNKYGCDVTLDWYTANKYIQLSGDGKKATATSWVNNYDNNPSRFDYWVQVLGHEPLQPKRCHYWEVTWSGVEIWVGVTYNSIKRTSSPNFNESRLGYNDKSWNLRCYTGGYEACHNSVPQTISIPYSSAVSWHVGVCVDYPHHSITFYRVDGDSLTELYTYKNRCPFKEPLYPAFGVCQNSYVTLGNTWQ